MATGDEDAAGRLFPEDPNGSGGPPDVEGLVSLDGVDPVSAVMLADAGRSITTYPDLLVAGALFTAAERVQGGWQVLCPVDPLPQGARERLAAHLYDQAGRPGAHVTGPHLFAAARVLERSVQGQRPNNDLVVAGRHFRIVRIEQLLRTGPDGPEPPRPSDHDPRPSGPGRTPPPRPLDFLPDGQTTPDLLTAQLLCQLLDATAQAGTAPAESFLTPVLLTPAFTIAERIQGRWKAGSRLYDTPQRVREALAEYFRHVVPAVEQPGAEACAQYAEAAELMEDRQRRNGISVAGRRFRIVRIERVALMGPDGPEPPRPSDLDLG